MDEQDVEETQAIADDDCDFGGDIARGVFGAEGLWADDVAGACEVG